MTAAAAHRPAAPAPARAPTRSAGPAATPAAPTTKPVAAVPVAPHVARHRSAHGAKHAATVDPARLEKVAALQTALGGEIARTARLEAPRFQVNTPANVTLTVPAGFADALRSEAGRQGLAQDAASAALTARLAGDGYVVAPDDAQRQVIASGQPTVFHWTVTAQPGARGVLAAHVGGELLGGGNDKLDLGSVTAPPASSGIGWRVLGGVLLALVVVLIVVLFSRSGRPPSARRRRSAPDGEVRRPQRFTP